MLAVALLDDKEDRGMLLGDARKARFNKGPLGECKEAKKENKYPNVPNVGAAAAMLAVVESYPVELEDERACAVLGAGCQRGGHVPPTTPCRI